MRMAQWSKVNLRNVEEVETLIEDELIEAEDRGNYVAGRCKQVTSLIEQGRLEDAARLCRVEMESKILDHFVQMLVDSGHLKFAWEVVLEKSFTWQDEKDPSWKELSPGAKQMLNAAKAAGAYMIAVAALETVQQPRLEKELDELEEDDAGIAMEKDFLATIPDEDEDEDDAEDDEEDWYGDSEGGAENASPRSPDDWTALSAWLDEGDGVEAANSQGLQEESSSPARRTAGIVEELSEADRRQLAEDIIAGFKEEDYFQEELSLRLECAISQACVARQNVRCEAPPEEQEASLEVVLETLRSLESSAKEHRVKVVSKVERWNELLKVIGQCHQLPQVFKALKIMESVGPPKDSATMTKIAHAAVSKVGFHRVADSFATLPQPELPEIVFVGRSNAGKSSLVNSVLARKALAAVAAMPGKTTRFHFYNVNKGSRFKKPLTLVDVPGLGVAVTHEEQLSHWKESLFNYLQKRGPTLRGVFHLVDSEAVMENWGLSEVDEEIMDMVQAQNVEYTMVLTKVDCLEGDNRGFSLRKQLIKDLRARQRSKAGVPCIVPSSVVTRLGRDRLWQRLWSCFDPANRRWKDMDLKPVQEELDTLAEKKDIDAIVSEAQGLRGEAWEYAVNSMLSLDEWAEAWRCVKDRLEEIATSAPLEFTPSQARATFATAVAALQVAPCSVTVPSQVLESADGHDIAEEAFELLRQGQEYGTAIELQLEQIVTDVQQASEGSPSKSDLCESLQSLQDNSEAWGVRPWSLDRWNRLQKILAEQRDLQNLFQVYDTMRALRVRESGSLHRLLEAASIRTSEVVAETSSLLDMPSTSLPEVIFVGTNGQCTSSEFLSCLLTNRNPRQEATPRRFEVNNDGDTGGLPAFSVLQVPVPEMRGSGWEAEEAASDFTDDFYGYLQQREEEGKPVHIFHSVWAAKYVPKLRGRFKNMSEHRPDEAVQWAVKGSRTARPGEQADLTLLDVSVQAAGRRHGASYTLVVADASFISTDRHEGASVKGRSDFYHAHPRVAAKRDATLIEELKAVTGNKEVILADRTFGRGAVQIWRLLWTQLQPQGTS